MSDSLDIIRGSQREYEEFTRSVIWRDLKSELEAWLDTIRTGLETVDDFGDARRLQGNAEAIRNMLQFPDRVIEAYKEDAYGTQRR